MEGEERGRGEERREGGRRKRKRKEGGKREREEDERGRGEREGEERGKERREGEKVEGGAVCPATLLYCACSRNARSQKRHPICKLKNAKIYKMKECKKNNQPT